MIELLVVVAILAILLIGLIAMLKPAVQIEKAKNATRQHDLSQIKNALDTYYNDHNCYPTSSPFDQEEWKEGLTTYMTKIPKDPDTGLAYFYEANGECPQWNVLFAKLSQSKTTQNICSLSSLSNCLPPNYDSSYACATSGKVDCTYVSSTSLPIQTPTPTIPTPTPCSRNYSCSGGLCNRIDPAGSGQYCTSNCDGNCR